MSIVGREIQLTKDYTTGNATFKQGSRGTVIEVPSRKDGKLKVKLDNDNEKTFRLINIPLMKSSLSTLNNVRGWHHILLKIAHIVCGNLPPQLKMALSYLPM